MAAFLVISITMVWIASRQGHDADDEELVGHWFGDIGFVPARVQLGVRVSCVVRGGLQHAQFLADHGHGRRSAEPCIGGADIGQDIGRPLHTQPCAREMAENLSVGAHGLTRPRLYRGRGDHVVRVHARASSLGHHIPSLSDLCQYLSRGRVAWR